MRISNKKLLYNTYIGVLGIFAWLYMFGRKKCIHPFLYYIHYFVVNKMKLNIMLYKIFNSLGFIYV